MSTGIVVRVIAPLIRSKTQDPAVVVVDDLGKNAVSLLSGHIGGANELTRRIAPIIGATPVITTATDVNTREIYSLFPNGPAKLACKIAGLAKPTGCL